MSFTLICDREAGWWEASLDNGATEPYRDSYLGVAHWLMGQGVARTDLPAMMQHELAQNEDSFRWMMRGRRNIYVLCHQCGSTHSERWEDCQVKLGEWTWYRWDCGCSEHVYDNAEVSA